MPPMTPPKKASRQASRVEDDAREQKPRARRRQSTEAMKNLEQETNTPEVQEVGMSEAQGSIDDQNSGSELSSTAEKAPRKRKRRRRDSKSQPQQLLPDSQRMARKYGEWKDDLEFVAIRGTYWGTVAPRLPDRVSKPSLSKENGDEQKREGTSCTPCILRGLNCSGDKPICIQCKPTGEAPAMCSYPINRAFIPKSKHVIRRRMKEVLESNLAAAVEYLDGRVDSEEEGGKKGGKERSKEATPSNEGSQKTGGQGEAESDEGTDSAVPVPERAVWLAKALLAEGREGRASYRPQAETRSEAAEEAQGRADKPVHPRKRGRPRGSRRTRDTRGRVIARLLRCDPKPRKPRKGELSGRNPPKLRNILKSTSRMLKAAGTWIEAPTTSAQGQELDLARAASSTDESDEDGSKTDDGDDLDTETATSPVPKYKKQIANTFRPWIAHQDDKVIPSACVLPETTFLQALHYYASYYYTHVSPSPDMFEAMDLTSHIALGMIIQEIISDFAFKLGKESQLEDIQVKVDKLIAAQHRSKWDANFVDYLKSLTADGSLPPMQRNKKRRQSRSGEGSSKSTDDAGSDTDGNEDGDNIGHGFRFWDELEGLSRTTTSLGCGTMKELVNRTSFNLDEDGDLGIDGGGNGDMDDTYSDSQQQLDRHLTAFTLGMDIDARSSDDSDVDKAIEGSSSRWTQSKPPSPEATILKQLAFLADSEAEDDVSLVSDENDLKVMDLESKEEDDDLDKSNQDENDMPEIDFSQSIFSQLSNRRFGSQFKFRLEDSTDEGEEEDEVGGFDRLRSRALIPSPIVLDKSDTSSEAESDGFKPYSEKAEKKEVKGSDADETMVAETDGGTQDEEDFSPSVLTQVNETRLGSAFTTRDDDSSSDDDFGFNMVGGRFLAQSQVVQDDSDDSSGAQGDSAASESEQENEDDEEENSVPAVHKEEEEEEEEEEDIKKNDGEGGNKKDSGEEKWNEDEKESNAEEIMDVEMGGDDIQIEEGFSPSVLTQVSETRFGSAFTYRDDDSSSEDDFGFNMIRGRFLAQSQVVQDDSDDSSEAQEDSSASESEQGKEGDKGEDFVPAMNKEEGSKEQDSKEEAIKDVSEEESGAKERKEAKEESDAEENMGVEIDGGIQDEEDFSPSVLTQVIETRLGSAFTTQDDDSSSEDDFGFNMAGGRFLAQSQVVQDGGGDTFKAQENDEEEDSVAAVKEEMKDIKKINREDDSEEESDAEEQKDTVMEDGEDDSEENAEENVDAEMDSGALEIEDDFPPSIFTQLSQSGFSSSFTSQDDGSSDEDFSFNIDGGRSLAQSQFVQKPAKETPSREGSIEQDEQVSSQQQFTTVNATRFGSQFSNSYDASDDDDESEDDGAGNATQSQVVLDDSTTDEEEIRVDNDSSDSD